VFPDTLTSLMEAKMLQRALTPSPPEADGVSERTTIKWNHFLTFRRFPVRRRRTAGSFNNSPSGNSFNLPYQASKSSTFFHEHRANHPQIGQQKEFAYILFPAINGKRHRAESMGHGAWGMEKKCMDSHKPSGSIQQKNRVGTAHPISYYRLPLTAYCLPESKA
jgi:hypothetical protein